MLKFLFTITYPTTLDAFSNPTSGELLENAVEGLDHDQQHANANDAIEALEAKVGVTSSAVTTSHDYKLSEVTDKAVGKTATQTLTNKTLTSPILNLSSNATGDIYYRASDGTLARLPIGTQGNILDVSAGGVPEWVANPAGITYALNVQEFLNTGTWTAPATGTKVFVQLWGAGGSGGSGSTRYTGGGGGAYVEGWFSIATMGASQTITIGDGGTPSTNAAGKVGGNTTVGSLLTAYGGGGGNGGGGGGGGALSVGADGTSSVGGAGGSPLGGIGGNSAAGADSTFGGAGGGDLNYSGGNSYYGGGGGRGTDGGGNSIWGGGGGGQGGGASDPGGTSAFGGAGGEGSSTAPTAGAVPGGGGGGTYGSAVASGAGGKGKCIITVF